MQVGNEETLLEIINQSDYRKYIVDQAKIVTEELASTDPFFKELKNIYESKSKSIEVRVAISILCYMYSTDKVTIPITTKIMEMIYADDPNWNQEEVPFVKDTYKKTLAILSKMGLKRIANSNDYRPGVLLASKESALAFNFRGDFEAELRFVFKLTNINMDDFVDENVGKLFGQYLERTK